MCRFSERRRQRGLTLIELVISIVIISIGATSMLMAYTTMIARSADPAIDVQAVAIAEAYLDEILAKPVAGPAGTPGVRSTYAIVDDYLNLPPAGEPPTDQFGTAIAGLGGFNVVVTIGADDFGAGGRSVTVTVSHPGSGRSVVLRGQRIEP